MKNFIHFSTITAVFAAMLACGQATTKKDQNPPMTDSLPEQPISNPPPSQAPGPVDTTPVKPITAPAKPQITLFKVSQSSLQLRDDQTQGKVKLEWNSTGETCSLQVDSPAQTILVAAKDDAYELSVRASTEIQLTCKNSTGTSEVQTLSVQVEILRKNRQICNNVVVNTSADKGAQIYPFIGQTPIDVAAHETILSRATASPSQGFQDIYWNGSRAKIATADILDSCDQDQTIDEGLLVLADGAFTDSYSNANQSCPVAAGTILDFESYVNGRSGLFTEIVLNSLLPNCSLKKGYLPILNNLKVFYYQGYPTAGAKKINEINGRPVVEKFSVDVSSLSLVEGAEAPVVVTWKSLNTTSCKIVQQLPATEYSVLAEGSQTIKISETTELGLSCEGAQGLVQAPKIKVEVKRPLPEITSFKSSAQGFFETDQATAINFSWETKYADKCSLVRSQPLLNLELEGKGTTALDFTLESIVTLQCRRGQLLSKPMQILIKRFTFSDANGIVDTSAQLRCYPGSTFQPQNRESELLIGKEGYGFSQLDECKATIKKSRNGLVCNWSGNGYEVYRNSDGLSAGKDGYRFSEIAACTEVVETSRFNVFCGWSGKGYSPYNSLTNKTVGKADYGFGTQAECVKTVSNAKAAVTCNWNGSNISPYYIPENRGVGKTDYGFTTSDECVKAVNSIKMGYMCTWDGGGYAIYDVKKNKQYSEHKWSTLDSCVEYVNNEI